MQLVGTHIRLRLSKRSAPAVSQTPSDTTRPLLTFSCAAAVQSGTAQSSLWSHCLQGTALVGTRRSALVQAAAPFSRQKQRRWCSSVWP